MRWLSVAFEYSGGVFDAGGRAFGRQAARPTHSLAFPVTAIFVAAITPFEFAMARARKHLSNLFRHFAMRLMF